MALKAGLPTRCCFDIDRRLITGAFSQLRRTIGVRISRAHHSAVETRGNQPGWRPEGLGVRAEPPSSPRDFVPSESGLNSSNREGGAANVAGRKTVGSVLAVSVSLISGAASSLNSPRTNGRGQFGISGVATPICVRRGWLVAAKYNKMAFIALPTLAQRLFVVRTDFGNSANDPGDRTNAMLTLSRPPTSKWFRRW